MKKSKNLSVKDSLPNRGIDFSCHSISGMEGCCSCDGMYYCRRDDLWSDYDDFILSQQVDIDCLPVQDRLFVEFLIDAL